MSSFRNFPASALTSAFVSAGVSVFSPRTNQSSAAAALALIRTTSARPRAPIEHWIFMVVLSDLRQLEIACAYRWVRIPLGRRRYARDRPGRSARELYDHAQGGVAPWRSSMHPAVALGAAFR